MHHFILMQHPKAIHYLHQKVNCFIFAKFTHFFEILLQIPVIAVLNHQVVVVLGFHKLVEMHYIWVVDLRHNRHFSLE